MKHQLTVDDLLNVEDQAHVNQDLIDANELIDQFRAAIVRFVKDTWSRPLTGLPAFPRHAAVPGYQPIIWNGRNPNSLALAAYREGACVLRNGEYVFDAVTFSAYLAIGLPHHITREQGRWIDIELKSIFERRDYTIHHVRPRVSNYD